MTLWWFLFNGNLGTLEENTSRDSTTAATWKRWIAMLYSQVGFQPFFCMSALLMCTITYISCIYEIGQAIGPPWDFCAPISIIVEL